MNRPAVAGSSAPPGPSAGPAFAPPVDLNTILVLSVLVTFPEAMVGRGVFYFTLNHLGYTKTDNLLLGVFISLVGAVGSLLTHRFSAALGEKRWLAAMLLLRVTADMTMYLAPGGPIFVACAAARLYAGGSLWPVVMSYLTAGRSQQDTIRSIGLFNIAWALAIPLAFYPSGWFLKHHPHELFITGSILHMVAALWAWLMFPAAPSHSNVAGTDAMDERQVAKLRRLLVSARWSTFTATLLLNLSIAVLPSILAELGYEVDRATALASVVEWSRFAAFVALGLWAGWHARRWLQLAIAMGLPLGILMVMGGPSVAWIVAGQVIFGLAGGAAYNTSFYYGMILQNASVKSAGRHEGLGGLGGGLGPLLGMACTSLTPKLGLTLGAFAGLGPALIVCCAGMIRPLLNERE